MRQGSFLTPVLYIHESVLEVKTINLLYTNTSAANSSEMQPGCAELCVNHLHLLMLINSDETTAWNSSAVKSPVISVTLLDTDQTQWSAYSMRLQCMIGYGPKMHLEHFHSGHCHCAYVTKCTDDKIFSLFVLGGLMGCINLCIYIMNENIFIFKFFIWENSNIVSGFFEHDFVILCQN